MRLCTSHLIGAVAALLLGCGTSKSSSGGDADTGSSATTTVEVTDFDLTVRMVLPLNQAGIFDLVSRLDLTVIDAGGTVGTWAFEDVTSGASGQAEGLPELSEAVLQFDAYDASGVLVASGRSAPVDLVEGEAEVFVLMAEAGAFGWLNSLSEGAAAAALATDGDGGFLLFGGTDRKVSGTGVRGGASNSVRRFDPTHPGDGLVFSTVGTMPAFDTTVEEPGRAGHSATRLGGTHDNRDLILVAGGSTDFFDSSQTTSSVFLWDPTTDTAEESTSWNLQEPVRHHVAVADRAGNVVLSGGSTGTESNNSISNTDYVYFFEGATLTMRPIELPTDDYKWLWHSAAAYGERGVLICGGYFLGSFGGEGEVLDECGIVNPSGTYTDQASSGISLPEPRMHHAMVGLADGSVLVTGGASKSGADVVVSNKAWVVDAAGTATEVGPMHMARALHSLTALPDGRVLVSGGVATLDGEFWDGEGAVACAELYNPDLGDFVEIGSCTADAPEGALAGPAAQPTTAVDPASGMAVVVGGYDRNNEGATGAAIYLAPGDD